ncbi:hypothetical protein FLA105534_01280 [Flavobacterium bizetiae]|uniref:Uncharacterized protein n=1 Tax=Flavobacterium bizetiae TaxID=2704140 RepID=A0A6J4GBY7_9FLAO|nr:rSAM-modified peptide [Flavobacterium bizetiae]CAA9196701.1 hypothetical protein FLA105534_01280 [Flavobacterium bizetiae]CAD5340747.1 hypothetical protein FLA105535_00703 [Flavobacterium bizetiae]CAD5347786.1 hypothetical protein FLA105534_01745 [Flavobacterium bizetiae]
MKNTKLNIGDFQTEKLSKNQQKTVSGGDVDPNKGDGKGNTVESTARNEFPKP